MVYAWFKQCINGSLARGSPPNRRSLRKRRSPLAKSEPRSNDDLGIRVCNVAQSQCFQAFFANSLMRWSPFDHRSNSRGSAILPRVLPADKSEF